MTVSWTFTIKAMASASHYISLITTEDRPHRSTYRETAIFKCRKITWLLNIIFIDKNTAQLTFIYS